jgi:hypothetical protein
MKANRGQNNERLFTVVLDINEPPGKKITIKLDKTILE